MEPGKLRRVRTCGIFAEHRGSEGLSDGDCRERRCFESGIAEGVYSDATMGSRLATTTQRFVRVTPRRRQSHEKTLDSASAATQTRCR